MYILPYVEQDNLQKNLNFICPRIRQLQWAQLGRRQVVKIFVCPSDPLPDIVSTYTTGGVTYYFGMNSYLGNGGTRSWYVGFQLLRGRRLLPQLADHISGIADGTSNTFLAGERYHKDPAYTNIETLGGWAWSNYRPCRTASAAPGCR